MNDLFRNTPKRWIASLKDILTNGKKPIKTGRCNAIDNESEQSRFRGCLLGLACGDAVGTTVEFERRGTFRPVTDMTGGGPFNLKPGEWTDDTSMACKTASKFCHVYNKSAFKLFHSQWLSY